MIARIIKKACLILTLLPLSLIVNFPSNAQQIIPNNDGTMTIVTQDGNRFNISGGKLSGDGKNLFHSLQEFGLDFNQIANFLSNPNIQNILTRINGGNPSIINGLIQVTGGNSNLYLMNPAGIIFGKNASLNVPSDFFATTATGIGFNGGWFNANGIINYPNLIGNPNALQFSDNSGIIINNGNLAVAPNQNLVLSGGMVINTGTLEANGGKITVTAVSGTNKVTISSQDSLISLEVEIPESYTAQNQQLKMLDLQGLLLGLTPEMQAQTGLNINPNGTVKLTNNNTQIPNTSGTTIISGNLDVSSANLGGQINIQGANIGLINANLNANGNNGGGQVLIGSDRPNINTSNNAQRTLINQDSVINADALLNGNGGQVFVFSNNQTVFNGQVTARGGINSGNGGFAEISGKNNLVFNGDVDLTAPQGNFGTLLFDPDNITILDGSFASNDTELDDNQILASDNPNVDFVISEGKLESLSANANVTLEANNNITINDLSDNQLIFQFNSFSGGGGTITFTADADNNGVGNFFMNSNDSIIAPSRNVSISAANITIGDIITRNNTSFSINGGTITLKATNGNINSNGTLDSSSITANGGEIKLTASGNINTGNIISQSESQNNNSGGNITLEAGGNINTTTGEGFKVAETSTDSLYVPIISSSSVSGDGGNINIQANGNIKVPFIASGSLDDGKGGNITINSANGSIDTTTLLELDGNQLTLGALASASRIGNGGNLNITASGNIETGIIATGNVGSGNAGEVTITSSNGFIDTSKGATISGISSSLLEELGVDSTLAALASQAKVGLGIVTISDSGNGGNVSLTAQGNITTSNIITGSFSGNGGDITLNSQQGVIDTTPGRLFENVNEELATLALSELNLNSQLASDLADLAVYFNDEGIGGLISLSLTGNAGAINLTAANDINTQYLIGSSFSGNGANLSIISKNGQIKVRNLTFNAAKGIIPNNINYNNQEFEQLVQIISKGVYNTSGATGGNITIEASNNITTAAINSSGNTGDGGDVTLKSNQDIQVTSINAQGGNNGTGGNVKITTDGFFRATGTFIDNNGVQASISTAGGNGGGTIAIYHGGNGITPFQVGDASVNGTAGAITSGNITINPFQSFLFTEIQDNIGIFSRLPASLATELGIIQPNPLVPLQAKVVPSVVPIVTINQAKEILQKIAEVGAEKPALIYVSFTPPGYKPQNMDEDFARRESVATQEFETALELKQQKALPTLEFKPSPNDQLDLLIITSEGEPIRVVTSVTRQEVETQAKEFYNYMKESTSSPEEYLPAAQQLYTWLVKPLESKLQEEKINNLVFVMPTNLRLIPLAALHDGEQFLVQKYSSGLAPSLNLNDNTYRSLKGVPMLAMGASRFEDPLSLGDLPAVEQELPIIKEIWQNQSNPDLINQNFTLPQIVSKLQQNPVGIVHLATHGSFNEQYLEDIYIQLYDRRLNFKEMGELGLNDPLVELLVLSACETAYGNNEIELGFAGLAVQAGVKSVVASLWKVSDAGTLGLMTDFYSQLKNDKIKAEALRKAQLDMLNKQIRKQGNQIITPEMNITISEESAQHQEDLSHPYYWAPFTMIGNPW